jgi:hypothetical protein
MILTKSTLNKLFISNHSIASIWQNDNSNQYSLHANKAFKKNEVITTFGADKTQNYATYLTVQVGVDKHITLNPSFLQYINHSCSPSVFFDTHTMQLIALKDIEADEEFTFFYPSTEWDMAQPFVCNCGSKNCLQLINGAVHLSNETLSQYKLTHFILQQLQATKQDI